MAALIIQLVLLLGGHITASPLQASHYEHEGYRCVSVQQLAAEGLRTGLPTFDRICLKPAAINALWWLGRHHR